MENEEYYEENYRGVDIRVQKKIFGPLTANGVDVLAEIRQGIDFALAAEEKVDPVVLPPEE